LLLFEYLRLAAPTTFRDIGGKREPRWQFVVACVLTICNLRIRQCYVPVRRVDDLRYRPRLR